MNVALKVLSFVVARVLPSSARLSLAVVLRALGFIPWAVSIAFQVYRDVNAAGIPAFAAKEWDYLRVSYRHHFPPSPSP